MHRWGPGLWPPLTMAKSSFISKDFGYNKKIITQMAIIWRWFGLLLTFMLVDLEINYMEDVMLNESLSLVGQFLILEPGPGGSISSFIKRDSSVAKNAPSRVT